MPEQLILDKLDKMERKVDKIEIAVGLIAVQNERINNIASQVHALWTKADEASVKINEVQKFQASCPRIDFRAEFGRQWVIISFLAVLVSGALLQAFGVFTKH